MICCYCDRYILTKNIGRGGFGEIWFAISKQCSSGLSKDSATHMQMPQMTVDGYLESQQPESESEVQAPTSWFGTEKRIGADSTENLFVLKRLLVCNRKIKFISNFKQYSMMIQLTGWTGGKRECCLPQWGS